MKSRASTLIRTLAGSTAIRLSHPRSKTLQSRPCGANFQACTEPKPPHHLMAFRGQRAAARRHRAASQGRDKVGTRRQKPSPPSNQSLAFPLKFNSQPKTQQPLPSPSLNPNYPPHPAHNLPKTHPHFIFHSKNTQNAPHPAMNPELPPDRDTRKFRCNASQGVSGMGDAGRFGPRGALLIEQAHLAKSKSKIGFEGGAGGRGGEAIAQGGNGLLEGAAIPAPARRRAGGSG